MTNETNQPLQFTNVKDATKIKVLTISDHPLSPSGVGTQTRYFIEHMLATGKFKFVSLGGAIKHNDYKAIKTQEFGDDWVIYPVDNFGNPEILRSVIRNERPDILWFMTDPRFYEWLWAMEDEIRPLVPMIYYHVWDNYPFPKYNRPYYISNDFVATISKVTEDIVANVAPEVEREYIPHSVNTDIFQPIPDETIEKMRKDNFPNWKKDKFLFVWNNRNAKRKMSGSLLWWFKEFLDKVGRDKAALIMHTDPHDPNGPDLEANLAKIGLLDGEVMFSQSKMPPNELAGLYNMADCVINISDAEGFGLATLESLACGTPIIVSMTGGLQEQITDGKNWFGIGIEPASKAIIGSQQVPYIYEDRITKEDFLDAMVKIYEAPKEELKKMGHAGREYVMKNYNFRNFREQWFRVLLHVNAKHGSWSERRNYKSWNISEGL